MQIRRARLLRVLAAAGVIALTPALIQAQSAQRTVADAPSSSRETRLQHDSLTVHFIRTPKGKPASMSIAGKPSSTELKFRGKAIPQGTAAPVETPLPTRAKVTKP